MKDKIRALLALASDPSAAPQEAESAGRMAGAAAHIPTGRPLAHRSGVLLNG